MSCEGFCFCARPRATAFMFCACIRRLTRAAASSMHDAMCGCVFVFEHFVGPAGRRAKRSPACLAFVAEEKAPMLITSRHRSSMRGPGRATILQHVSLRMPIQAIYADASWDSAPLSSPPTSLLTWPALFLSPESLRSGLHCLIEHQSTPNPPHHSIPTG